MKRIVNILSMIALVGGVVAGVVLVQQNQDFREKASKENKVKVCHKTGSGEHPWQQIEVAEPAVQSHLDHGDMIGDCPKEEDHEGDHDNDNGGSEPTQEPTQAPTEAPTQAPTTEPTQAPTQAPVESQQPESTQTSQATQSPVATQSSGDTTINNNITNNTTTNNTTNNVTNNTTTDNSTTTSSNTGTSTTTTSSTQNSFTSTNKQTAYKFTFKVRLQSINSQGPDKNTTLSFYQGKKLMASRNTTTSSDANGIYTGVTQSVDPGSYDVVVKVNGYLAKKFKNVNVVSGNNLWNWSVTRMIAGDFDNNNVFNLYDIGLFLSEYTKSAVPVNSNNNKFDVDNSKVINEDDLNIILANYNTLNLEGDK